MIPALEKLLHLLAATLLTSHNYQRIHCFFSTFNYAFALFPQCQARILLSLCCSLPILRCAAQDTPVAILGQPQCQPTIGVVQNSHQEASCVDSTHPRVGAYVMGFLQDYNSQGEHQN